MARLRPRLRLALADPAQAAGGLMANISSRGNTTRKKVEAYSTEKARDLGRRAWDEQASAENPYIKGTDQHKAWSEGWREARDKACEG